MEILNNNGRQYYVSLSAGNVFSGISGTTVSFLCPNMNYINKVVNGDVGITEKSIKTLLKKEMMVALSKRQSTIDVFMNNFNLKDKINNVSNLKDKTIDVNDVVKNLKNGGNINTDIISTLIDGINVDEYKSIEKTVVTTLLETEKPYIEIIKMFLSSLVVLEDCAARYCPLLSDKPLKAKSLKPIYNDGSYKGNKALGYSGAVELNNTLTDLGKTLTKSGTMIDKDGKYTNIFTNNIFSYVTVSIDYSTGSYISNVDYEYIYNDIDDSNVGISISMPNLSLSEDDKPNVIVLGIYDKNGTPFNPNDYIDCYDINNPTLKGKSTYKKAEWLTKTDKWLFGDDIYQWDVLHMPKYRYTNNIIDYDSFDKPIGDKWKIKKYKKKDKDIISGKDAIEGNPIILGFSDGDKNVYKTYFDEFIKEKINSTTSSISQTEKDGIIASLQKGFNIQQHLENINTYGQIKSSIYNDDIPSNLKDVVYSIKRFHLTDGRDIWLDPETEYDLKIIKVIPTTKIKYQSNDVATPSIFTYESFIKNEIVFSYGDNTTFSISIQKNDETASIYDDVSEYVLDNWNYSIDKEIPSINNTNTYKIYIKKDGNIILNGVYDISNLPVFGKKIIVNLNNNSYTTEDLNTQYIKIVNDTYPYGKIIDISKLDNAHLITNSPYSDGMYGYGDNDEKQSVGVVYRYMLTDLDIEPYYIVEGILSSANTNNSVDGVSNKKWYKLPQALGSVIKICGTMGVISTTILPLINSANTIYKDPVSFLVDIINNKFGKYVPFLTDKARQTMEKAFSYKKEYDSIDNDFNELKTTEQQKIDDRTSNNDGVSNAKNVAVSNTEEKKKNIIIKKDNIIQKINKTLKDSDIHEYVYVDKKDLAIKCIYDGNYIENASLFGKDIKIGIKLDTTEYKKPISIIYNNSIDDILSFLKKNGKLSDGVDVNDVINDYLSKNNDNNKNKTYETLSIEYSTGKYIKGVDYKYIYINIEDKALIDEINNFLTTYPTLNEINNSKDIINYLNKAGELYDKTKGLLDKYPNNQYIKDIIDRLKKSMMSETINKNPILYITIQTLIIPIKIAINIIKEIYNFYKKIIKNPTDLTNILKDFLTFEWIKEIFKPDNIFSILGMNIKLEELSDLIDTYKDKLSKEDNKKDMTDYSERYKKILLDKYIGDGLIYSFGTYTIEQLIEYKDEIFKMIGNSLCIIESIINGIIDMFFSLLEIEQLVKVPHIKLCSNSDKSEDVINASKGDLNINLKFVYDIKLDDGTMIKGLSEEELRDYENNHPDIKFNIV